MFIEIVAQRTGTNVETDLYPHLVTAAMGAAVKVALKPVRARASPSPVSVIREAFALLRAGLPEPPR
jgi:hypothetical protein